MSAKAVVVYAVGLPAYVLVKSLTPNFFARGDTRTPVKYSMVVLATNLIFAILLMKPFGHVGIASATTISAFVSLFQYMRGLKKREFWSCSRQLLIKIIKICICSLIMSLVIYLTQYVLNLSFGNWLHLSILPKLGLFSIICILGFITFIFCAKVLNVINIKEVIAHLLKKELSDAKEKN
jgi:putative peptidoglycan lipid II flippase